MKAKVKKKNDVVNTIFSDNETSKESVHYICISAINICHENIYTTILTFI